MTSEITNVAPSIEIKNNIWTLTKHVAHSVNVTAGKVDAKVYGPIVKEHTVQLPPQSAPMIQSDSMGFWQILGGIAGGILIIAIFVLYWSGAIKGRDFIGF